LAGIGVVGLALGFAFQDIASNFMSGVIMALREPFRVGDLVETHDTMGHVERVTLRATVVRDFSGQLVMIPNKDVLQNPITNYTQTGKRRVEVPVGISYGDDLGTAANAARGALEKLEDRDESEPVEIWWTDFGSSSINLSARFWIDLENGSNYFAARSRAIEAIHHAFADADITIPFPIRTLDFGIRGGADLSEMLAARESE
jgi:small conductance mechanosensitive channel